MAKRSILRPTVIVVPAAANGRARELEIVAGAGVTLTATQSGERVTLTVEASGGGSVSSVFGRAGAVVAVGGDYTAAQVGADAAGTAESGDSAHVAAIDPHNQYALEADLGGAAALDVGTGPGTVAAGDQAAGGDASGTLPALVVNQARGLRETGGPTTLTMGAVADGQSLRRVGATVVGAWLALAYATSPLAEIAAPGSMLGTYTTEAGTVA